MTSKRNIYLKMMPLTEARSILERHFLTKLELASEVVPVPEAVGRVLAEPVLAKLSSPHFHASAMDGIAVQAESTYGASETSPKELVMRQDAFYVNTGHVLPAGTNAVIMIENVNDVADDRVEIEAPAFPWQYVRKMGEDIVATELLFAQNHLITPYCIGALLSGGVFEVRVKQQPKVLIIPTGTEVVDWHLISPDQLQPGQVLESNTYVLGKLVEACGGCYERHAIIQDDVAQIMQAVEAATRGDFDMVLTIGGSSAGSEDFAKQVYSQLGEVLVHGVTMMPGKPILIAKVNDKPAFGIPGYQVSAIVAFEQFVRPLICRMLGQPEPQRPQVSVEPTRKMASKLGVEEFVRVKLGQVGERIVATTLPRGAGSITSLTEADGIIRIPNELEGINALEPVPAELLRPLASIRRTIVAVGSHDNTLDVLADMLKASPGGWTLSSSHVGSMGGLMAVKKGLCHVAGTHLLDEKDGSYNTSYIERFLPGINTRLVHLVDREQGLMVKPGNPKQIQGLEDLSRKDVSFINRQSGSGTRILLDYRLKQLGIDPTTIAGYDTEEFTHMSVAVAVLSGLADVGLGIYAAAKALALDFIPVVTEQYDLVIPEEYFRSDAIQGLMDTIHSDMFRQRVGALGGYSVEKTGRIII
jgi:putative molybdopterin biosynthesis protein